MKKDIEGEDFFELTEWGLGEMGTHKDLRQGISSDEYRGVGITENMSNISPGALGLDGVSNERCIDGRIDLNYGQVVPVISCDVDGELHIISVEPLERSGWKLFLTIIASVLTLTVYLVLLRNIVNLRKWSYFRVASISEATHFFVRNSDGKCEIIHRQSSKNSINNSEIVFLNRHLKYAYNPDQKAFKAVYFSDLESLSVQEVIKSVNQSGIASTLVESMREKYGECKIEVPIPTLGEYLVIQLTELFFIFQYISVIIWVIEGFLIFAVVMILASLIITMINFFLQRKSLSKLRKFAENKISVKVIRDQQVKIIGSSELLPGDLFHLENSLSLPCDSLLISGNALVNESSLTGESIPILKSRIDMYEEREESFTISHRTRTHILYEGTQVIQVKGEKATALVLRTGYTSFRGGIFRAMLYPKQIPFNFQRNGIYFMLFLMFFALVAYCFMLWQMIEISLATKLIVLRFLDTLMWIIPPALPIFFSVCQTIALIRLTKLNIFATDPAKVVVASDLTVMCFDKTGTLTQDSMEVKGYYDNNCKDIKQSIKNEKDVKLLQKAFAACHGVYLINKELLGDVLDVRMLEFSGFNLHTRNDQEEGVIFKATMNADGSASKQISVLRTWEFESALQRMTCIFRDESDGKKHFAIMKGSPEIIASMCKQDTLNHQSFTSTLSELTGRGLRVIAFAGKEVRQEEVQQIYRNEAEKGLAFLGLLVLENPLKLDTAEVISRIKFANVNCKVISGDNLLTTVQCAKDAGLIDNDQILLCESLDKTTFEKTNQGIDMIEYLESPQQKGVAAVTGNFLLQFLHMTSSINNKGKQDFLIKEFLRRTVVFARIKPEQKAQIIYLIQTNLKTKVGMIGDGANDCPAIKQADIGISFTKTDASFSSPFSYSKTSLECVEKILAEGRCTMTSMIECYRYYLSASVFKYIVAYIMVLEYSYLSSVQILVINYCENIIYLLFLSLNKPLENLTPYKSISNMLDPQNFFSVCGQIIIAIVQLATHSLHLRAQPWFDPIVVQLPDKTFGQIGQTDHVMFLAIQSIFIFSLLSYFTSWPTKKRLYDNIALTVILTIISIFVCVLYLAPTVIGTGFGLDKIVITHPGFLGVQFIIAIGFGCLMIVYEDLIVKKFLGPNRKCIKPQPLE